MKRILKLLTLCVYPSAWNFLRYLPILGGDGSMCWMFAPEGISVGRFCNIGTLLDILYELVIRKYHPVVCVCAWTNYRVIYFV